MSDQRLEFIAQRCQLWYDVSDLDDSGQLFSWMTAAAGAIRSFASESIFFVCEMFTMRQQLCIVLIWVLRWSWTRAVASDAIPATRDLTSVNAPPNIPSSEMQALHDLYDSTQGEHWLWHAGSGAQWDFTDTNANPCVDNWQGLGCIYEGGTYMHIYQVVLPGHGLNGTLPATVGQWPLLTEFAVCNNSLVGPIPANFSALSNLTELVLCSNFMTGPIPESLTKLAQLQLLILKNNALTGTLPDNLNDLSQLTDLDVAYNHIEGSIPECIGQLTQLTSITLHYNRITGTIPAVLGDLPLLQVLYLQNNTLHGTVPASLGSLSQLIYLDVDSNALTGSVPETLAYLHQLEIFSMERNQLTGTLPAFLGNYSHLQYLTIYENYLTGSLPDTLGGLSVLFEFSVAHNYLTGIIPASVALMPTLNSFIIDHNQISGSLDGTFDSAVQTGLVSIIVNNNQLTGTIPGEIFQLPALRTVVASTNCFHGELPANICTRTTLVSVVFDGLSAAPACKNTLLPGLSHSYTLETTVYGTIPTCLFELPQLLTLHVSGNGFTGSLLSDTAVVGPQLIDLSLSHNVLTGSIPSQLQQHSWISLDLSYNRLQGSLLPSLASTKVHLNHTFVANDKVSLSLENNRLSGAIPGSVRNIEDISILGTNTFTCKVDGSDLPQHDSGVNNYQCGSQEFDEPYYVWLGLCCLCAIVLVCAVRFESSLQQYVDIGNARASLQSWWDSVASCGAAPAGDTTTTSGNAKFSSFVLTKQYCNLLDSVCKHALGSTCVIVVTLLPLYTILSHYYGTHTQSYAWAISAAYLSGDAPFSLELVLWSVILCAAMVSLYRYCTVAPNARVALTTSHPTTATEATTAALVTSNKHLAMIYSLYFALNIAIVGGANVAYVYVSIYRSSQLLTFTQICMSFFKVIYNGVASTSLLRNIVQMVTGQPFQVSGYASLRAVSALMNNIVIPFVVVLVVSPSCFYNVFSAAPSVNAVFTYEVCKTVSADSTQCEQYSLQGDNSSYDPPFTYSYQCSSSLITYYAPAFVLTCIVSTFVMPTAHLLAVQLLRRSDTSSRWYKLLHVIVPSTWQLPAPGETQDRRRVYFNPLTEHLVQLNLVALLFTFGLVFPPLAAALTVTLAVCCTVSKLKLGRLLSSCRDNNCIGFASSVENACASLLEGPLLRDFVCALSVISSCFCALFLFDTLGDAVGFGRAYWVLLLVPLLPACIICTLYMLGARGVTFVGATKGQQREVNVATSDLHRMSKSGLPLPNAAGPTSTANDAETFNVILNSL